MRRFGRRAPEELSPTRRPHYSGGEASSWNSASMAASASLLLAAPRLCMPRDQEKFHRCEGAWPHGQGRSVSRGHPPPRRTSCSRIRQRTSVPLLRLGSPGSNVSTDLLYLWCLSYSHLDLSMVALFRTALHCGRRVDMLLARFEIRIAREALLRFGWAPDPIWAIVFSCVILSGVSTPRPLHY